MEDARVTAEISLVPEVPVEVMGVDLRCAGGERKSQLSAGGREGERWRRGPGGSEARLA